MGNPESAAEFLKGLSEETERRLKDVRFAHQDLQVAKKRYEDAVFAAHEHGCSNPQIARQVGMTETAIRLFLKRRKEKKQ